MFIVTLYFIDFQSCIWPITLNSLRRPGYSSLRFGKLTLVYRTGATVASSPSISSFSHFRVLFCAVDMESPSTSEAAAGADAEDDPVADHGPAVSCAIRLNFLSLHSGYNNSHLKSWFYQTRPYWTGYCNLDMWGCAFVWNKYTHNWPKIVWERHALHWGDISSHIRPCSRTNRGLWKLLFGFHQTIHHWHSWRHSCTKTYQHN